MSKTTSAIHKVVVVFKTHLDIGFTDYAGAVRSRYMEDYLPRAMALARAMKRYRDEDSAPTRRKVEVSRPPFVWSTGSWLVYEALEEYKGRRLRELESAIAAGHIAWHAIPFTTHSELMDASLFRFGLSLSVRLDRRFGKNTIAAKMTDVPGHTRAMVPLLADAGIRFLHIGINPASTPPDVPDAFVWRHDHGTDLTVVYDHGDYGGNMVVPGLSCALVLAHTGDNLGPPTTEGVRLAMNRCELDFPRAEVFAGRLDDFAVELERIKKSLPVLTEEMGDTWIHGVGSDPGKVAQFRELQRLNSRWQHAKHPAGAAGKLDAFRRSLMMIPEHTWGMDEKTHLNDFTRYGAADLKRMRRTKKCIWLEASWQEQRSYIRQAVDLLHPSSLREEAEEVIASLRPRDPEIKGFQQVSAVDSLFTTSSLSIGFDSLTGDINHLKDLARRRTWATEKCPLASYAYETFSSSDYERFKTQYLRIGPKTIDWAIKDFTKPGIEALRLKHQTARPVLDAIWHRAEKSGEMRFILRMHMPGSIVKEFGAPAELTMEVHVQSKPAVIDIVLQWFGKPACRLPEASWMSFCPRINHASGWLLKKTGSWISPLDVVKNGNRKLHAVEEIRYEHGGDFLGIESLDAPLVAPGERSLLDFNNRLPPLKRGMHFNLHNNVWGTNFPMWYEEDSRFRFRLDLEQPGRPGSQS